VSDITMPSSPLIALGVDDAANPGPAGTTNAVVVTTPKAAGATAGVEAFVVRHATSGTWSGGPALSAGIYAVIYRGHTTGTDLASGVTFTFGPPPPTMTDASRDFYFQSDIRTTLNPSASATGPSGTALVSGANLAELYSGAGSLPATCRWEVHSGAAIPFVIVVQLFRPTSQPGATCPL
jgi:hypothetical protein